ncbi:MAG: type 1 pili tip component [Thiobacillus sp.]
MRIAELIHRWHQEGQTRTDVRVYTVHLPLRDAARIEALNRMYPGRGTSQLMADLVRAALDELEVAMPYIPGDRVIAEDDYGDPIYEDIGPTPQFYSLSHEILRKLTAPPQDKKLSD